MGSSLVANAAPKKIVITFSENIANNANIDPADFKVKVDSGAYASPSAAAVASGKVELTLASDVTQSNVVKIKYTKNTGATTKNIADAAGNAVGDIAEQTVTNNIDTAPTYQSSLVANA